MGQGAEMVEKSFLDLAPIHQELEELFFLHQEALLDFDYPEAIARFNRYRSGLMLHMGHEEQWLLPIFERIGEIKRWPPKLYYGEHEKMRLFLGKMALRLEALAAEGSPARRQLLALLDLQTSFKHLCDHHDIRERESFFPVLDQVTSKEEKRMWVDKCQREWRAFCENTAGAC